MTALGIVVLWSGYAIVLYGYCLFRGYQVTPKQIVSSKWPPGIMAIPSSTTPGGSQTVTV